MNNQAEKKDELVFVPLGGAGEIGMNLYAYGYGQGDDKNWLLIDMGVSFGGPNEPGINLIMPDISFLEERRENILGLFITHAHEDHIGAVSHLWSRLKMPVYATPFAGLMLKGKLLETGLYDEVPVHSIKPAMQISLGPFLVEPFSVIHSIPEACGFILEVAGKRLVHSGDWRDDEAPVLADKMDVTRLTEIGDAGCDFLVCDSTNVLSDKKSRSETDVADNLRKVVQQAPGRVLITTFASNIGRISSIFKIAQEMGRDVVLAGRAMERSVMLAREVGILTNLPNLVPVEDFDKIPRDKVLVLCTGSQGEKRAQCARISSREHNYIELEGGDWVLFSSKTIPGNERDVGLVENSFARLGVKVINSDMEPIHETGHPRQGELKKLYEILRPDCLIPMHGEARHLYAHLRFALKQGISKSQTAFNGDMLRLFPGEPEKIDEVQTGRLLEDGNILVSEENGPVKRRRKLGFVGCVSVSLVVTERGELVSDANIICAGLPERVISGLAFDEVLLEAVYDAFEALPKKRRGRREVLSEAVRRAVRKRAHQLWGKKPQTHILVSVV